MSPTGCSNSQEVMKMFLYLEKHFSVGQPLAGIPRRCLGIEGHILTCLNCLAPSLLSLGFNLKWRGSMFYGSPIPHYWPAQALERVVLGWHVTPLFLQAPTLKVLFLQGRSLWKVTGTWKYGLFEESFYCFARFKTGPVFLLLELAPCTEHEEKPSTGRQKSCHF